MHLVITGPIRNLYATQVALTHARSAKSVTDNLSARFHQDIKFWQILFVEMTTLPTYLTELVHQAASDLGYTNAPGKGSGGV